MWHPTRHLLRQDITNMGKLNSEVRLRNVLSDVIQTNVRWPEITWRLPVQLSAFGYSQRMYKILHNMFFEWTGYRLAIICRQGRQKDWRRRKGLRSAGLEAVLWFLKPAAGQNYGGGGEFTANLPAVQPEWNNKLCVCFIKRKNLEEQSFLSSLILHPT
jgi:hypothetical protein